MKVFEITGAIPWVAITEYAKSIGSNVIYTDTEEFLIVSDGHITLKECSDAIESFLEATQVEDWDNEQDYFLDDEDAFASAGWAYGGFCDEC